MRKGEVWFVEFPLEEDASRIINRPVIVLDENVLGVLSVKIIQTNIRKEQISPKTSSFRGFLYIPINLSDTAKTHEISTVTNT